MLAQEGGCRDLNQAYGEFSFVVDKLVRGDSYALIGKANINYEQSTRCRDDPHKQSFFLNKAMNTYIEVLERDECNAFASLGIANILSEYGKVQEALEIYKVLRESNPHLPQPLVNLAHLNMSEGNYEAAINFYQKALDLYPGRMDLEIELYLSKAYYKHKAFDQCKKLLISLIQRYPSNLLPKFNLVLCLTNQVNETFNKQFRRVHETEEATR